MATNTITLSKEEVSKLLQKALKIPKADITFNIGYIGQREDVQDVTSVDISYPTILENTIMGDE